MNNPDKAGEPSMDEILASIRKIIAEEPAEARADSEPISNPLLTGTELRPSSQFHLDDRPRPSADRLTNALKALAAAPPPPPARRSDPFAPAAHSTFEDDLSELLDDQSASSVFNGSLPEPILTKGTANASSPARPYMNGSHVLPDDDDLPPEGPAQKIMTRPAWAVDGDVANSPVVVPFASITEMPHIDAIIDAVPDAAGPTATADTSPAPMPPVPPTSASPWESMRKKNGFWPPKNNANAQAYTPPSEASNGTAFPGSGAFPPPDAPRGNYSAPPVISDSSTTDELVARLQAGLYETPVAPEPNVPPHLQFAAPLGAGGQSAPPPPMNGASYAAAASPAPPSYVSPYAPQRTPEPAPVAAASTRDPYAAPMSTEALMEAAFAALTASSTPPVPPRDVYGRPTNAEPPQQRYADPYANGGYGSRPDPAAAALDALAQGLAASPRFDQRRAYDYQPSAPTSSRQSPSHQSPSHQALVPQPLLPAVQEYYPLAIRTLEDSVADMLKPLLQKWLADNMPRIIERALRVEAASGMKPPGSS